MDAATEKVEVRTKTVAERVAAIKARARREDIEFPASLEEKLGKAKTGGEVKRVWRDYLFAKNGG